MLQSIPTAASFPGLVHLYLLFALRIFWTQTITGGGLGVKLALQYMHSNHATLSNSKWSMSLKNPSQNSSTDQKTGYSIYMMMWERDTPLVNTGGEFQYSYAGCPISAYIIYCCCSVLQQILLCSVVLFSARRSMEDSTSLFRGTVLQLVDTHSVGMDTKRFWFLSPC